MTSDENLLSQTEARAEAARRNIDWHPQDMVWVAHTVPLNAWGGAEEGWSLSLVPALGAREVRDGVELPWA